MLLSSLQAISRSRFWGTPLPIWISEDLEEVVVVGSVAELEELTGEKVRGRVVWVGLPHFGCLLPAHTLHGCLYQFPAGGPCVATHGS